MARRFVRASEQALYALEAPVVGYPFTLACWLYYHSINSGSWFDETVVALTDKDDGYDRDVLAVNQNGGIAYLTAVTSTNWDAHSRTPSAGMGVSAGQWYHGAAIFASGSSRRAALDGVFGAEATAAMSPNARDAVGVACLPRAAGPEYPYPDVSVAEVGIWRVALSEPELALLADGLSPLLVRPADLVFYAPLLADEDRDLYGIELTAHNAPTVVEHVRVLYPSALWVGTPGAGGGPGTDDLAADGLATGAVTLGEPTLGQVHELAADDLDAGAVDLGDPDLTQTNVLAADSLASGAVDVGEPDLTQVHELIAASLASGAVALGEPGLGQVHDLAADDLAAGAIELGEPDLASYAGVFNLVALGLDMGALVIGEPELGQEHELGAAGLDTGAVWLGEPTLVEVGPTVLVCSGLGMVALDMMAPSVAVLYELALAAEGRALLGPGVEGRTGMALGTDELYELELGVVVCPI